MLAFQSIVCIFQIIKREGNQVEAKNSSFGIQPDSLPAGIPALHWEKGWLGEGVGLSSTRAGPALAHRSCWKAALILSCSHRSRSYKYQLSSWCSWRTARQQALQQAGDSQTRLLSLAENLTQNHSQTCTAHGLPGNVLVQRQRVITNTSLL